MIRKRAAFGYMGFQVLDVYPFDPEPLIGFATRVLALSGRLWLRLTLADLDPPRRL